MMIFKKAIPRRMFLKSTGVAIGLPLLDAMIPAFAGPADTAAKPAVRLSIVYVPNGIIMEKWTPAEEGAAFKLTPTLEPLVAFQDRMLVLSGLADKEAIQVEPGEAGGDHTRAFASYLTGVRIKPTKGKDLISGISMDQVVAKEFGKHTQLASLEISMATSQPVGTCEPNYTCAYLSTLSWRGATTPLPMENNPRSIFERLFGESDTTDPAARLALLDKKRSILDSLAKDATRFQLELGPSDRAKVTEYLDAIRDAERRIQLAEEQASREVPTIERPAGVPEEFEEYAKLMIDLQALAYQSDLTRVITFMMAREGPFGSRSYPEIGIAEPHHTLSHHQMDRAKIDLVSRINLYHAKTFAKFLEKLRSTPDGDGSLLDHSLILYGSDMSDGNTHSYFDLPIALLGAAGQIKGGRHFRYPQGTPLTNLYLTMLEKLGLPMERFGDSTGKLDLLSVA